MSMKTPITYYGGKQRMLPLILPIIPEHRLYCEPFIGGAAVFFGKASSEVEVINDTNQEMINFYRVVQNDYLNLEKLVRVTLHSRRLHKDAAVVYEHPHLFSDLKRAWAVWVLSSQSFCAQLDGTWGYEKKGGKVTSQVQAKKERFTEELAIRLQNVQIECADALYIIKSRDTAESFFYCDPPYFNSNCGHYDGYTKEDFERLLETLAGIKGKFLLSSYPSDVLLAAIKAHGWYMKSTEQKVTVNAKSGYLKRKVEVLTSNYEI